ncbi:MAG: hypothetical protein K6T83_09285 [Alicyclobacillus sp.]|nr:hypothetical protein [Alicyclobacillus sp.]
MSQAIVPPSAVPFSAPAITAGGINGLGSLRFVGTINGGPPTTGTYQTGDVVLDLSNLVVWICQSGGTPGTWVALSYLRTDANAPNPQTVASQLNVGKPIYTNGGYVQANDPSGTNGSSVAAVLSNGQYQAAIGIHPGGSGYPYISHYDGSQWHEIDFTGGNISVPGYVGVPGGSGNFPGFYFSSLAPSGFNPGNSLGIFLDSSGAMGFNVGSAQRAYITNAGTTLGNLLMALSGGYKVQSGQTPPPSTSTGSNLISVTFPVSFMSTPQIIVTPELSNPQVLSYSLANPSSTGFNIAYYNYSTPTNFVAFHWVAIGS